MHLLRTAHLVTQLSLRAVPNEDKAKYLLASFLVFNVVYYSGLAVSTAAPWSMPGVIEAVAIMVINILGVVKAFDASGGKNNPDFVVEFTCLYVPVSITTVAAVWGGYWAISLGFHESILALAQSDLQFAKNLAALGTDLIGFLTLLANVCVPAITYYRICKLLSQVSDKKLISPNPTSIKP
jgi:hypothetical protein